MQIPHLAMKSGTMAKVQKQRNFSWCGTLRKHFRHNGTRGKPPHRDVRGLCLCIS
ncbi:hypothetical protein ECIAI1_4517 [Escherichia coli IAI1]|nr:hypothetical protein ECIAI1_4517 [Escherichia coli IAI1]